MCCRVNPAIVITECGIGFLDGPFRLCAPCEPEVEFNDLAVAICM